MSDKEEHKEINGKLDSILKILNGNGKIGLCAKVNILWVASVFIVGVSMTALIKSFF